MSTSGDPGDTTEGDGADGDTGTTTASAVTDDGSTSGSSTGQADESSDSGTTGMVDPGPMVDLDDPQLYEFEFQPSDADPAATVHDEMQAGMLDTTVPLQGRLVVFMHGAGYPTTCGSRDHGRMLAGLGFHVFEPCYFSNYDGGIGSCGDDFGGCRLEAFEGVDHTDVIDIAPPDSTEVRVVRGLEYLQAMHPGGDWQYFLDGDMPRWDKIVISGSSHGASSSGVVGMNRVVDRVVSLAGPLDSAQAWQLGDPMTAIDKFFAFTHTGDSQHPGHLDAFEALGLPGQPTVVDGIAPPYTGSHRLVSEYPVGNGHGAVTAGGASPQRDDAWVYLPVWAYMYGAEL